VSEFTHDISIVATIAGLDPIEVYATQTIADVEHFSRGVIGDANPEIPGTTGGVAGNRPDFLFVIAKGDEVQVELDNGDDMDVSLLKGQTFGMLSGKTFTRTTDAGDTAVSTDAVGLNTVVGGRGSTFEYLAVTKEPADPCEGALQITVNDADNAGLVARGTSGYVTLIDPSGNTYPIANDDASIALDALGTWCMYASDVNGNPLGTINFFLTGFEGIDPIDFTPFNGFGPFANFGGLESFELQLIDWTSVALPSLVGSNDALIIDGVNLTSITIPAGTVWKRIAIIAPIDSTSVDALCNALDATATGQTSSFVGTAAATAASLANRLAYLVNNALTFTP
jgi:hypothetical protein